MAELPKQTKRKPNWSNGEVGALASAYAERSLTIEGRFNHRLTAKDKSKAWDDIVEIVNSSSHIGRNLDETKKKLSDLKTITKKKERQRVVHSKTTGGGPPADELLQWELKILDTLPKETVYGLEDGIDTFNSNEKKENTTGTSELRVNMSSVRDVESEEVEETAMTPHLTPVKKEPSPIKKRRISSSPQGTSYQERLLDLEEEKIKLKRMNIDLLKERNEIEIRKINEIKKVEKSLDALLAAILLK